ncbi:hypothetical protein R6Q57_024616, partial [Mikania cordata]
KGVKKVSSSILWKPELPLCRYGKGNKLGYAIVNSRVGGNKNNLGRKDLNLPSRGREMIACDDIL